MGLEAGDGEADCSPDQLWSVEDDRRGLAWKGSTAKRLRQKSVRRERFSQRFNLSGFLETAVNDSFSHLHQADQDDVPKQ